MNKNSQKLNSALESFQKDALKADPPYQRVGHNIKQVDVIGKRPVKKKNENVTPQPSTNNIGEVDVVGKRPVKEEPDKTVVPEKEPVVPYTKTEVKDKSQLLFDIRNGGYNRAPAETELRKQLEAEDWAPDEIDNAIKNANRLSDFTQNKKYHIDLFKLENKLQGLNKVEQKNTNK